jgi:hypothetical protein
MSAQTSGFRAACREQAELAMTAFARFWGRYAPQGRGRIALRAGCLLFAPFITLFVWLVQGMIWMVISAPILAYALLMAAVGGGFFTRSPTASAIQSDRSESASAASTFVTTKVVVQARGRGRGRRLEEGSPQRPRAPRRRWYVLRWLRSGASSRTAARGDGTDALASRSRDLGRCAAPMADPARTYTSRNCPAEGDRERRCEQE